MLKLQNITLLVIYTKKKIVTEERKNSEESISFYMPLCKVVVIMITISVDI